MSRATQASSRLLFALLLASCARTTPLGDEPAAATNAAGAPGGNGATGGAGGTGDATGRARGGATPGDSGGAPLPTAGSTGTEPDARCNDTGWCCDPTGLCCNERLGICQSGTDPAGSGDGFAGGTPAPGPPPIMRPPPDSFGGTAGPDLGECRNSMGSGSAGYCEAQFECERGFLFVNCYAEGDIEYCGCELPYGYLEYQVSGAPSPGASCLLIADLCIDGTPADAGDAGSCALNHQEQGPDFCGTEWECRHQVQLLDASVTATSVEYRSTYCNSLGDAWSCDCNSNVRHTRLELSGDRSGSTVCNEAMELCASGPFEASGPVECVPTSQFGDPLYCNVELQCLQDAEANGEPVRIYDYRHAECQRGSGVEWRCFCSGADTASDYALEGDSGWDVCTRASEICAEAP